jgi:hypothetical protein
LASVLAWGARGRKFESSRPDKIRERVNAGAITLSLFKISPSRADPPITFLFQCRHSINTEIAFLTFFYKYAGINSI